VDELGHGPNGTSIGWSSLAIAVVWLCAWMVRAALGSETTERAKGFAVTMGNLGQGVRSCPRSRRLASSLA
jgi:hypothetical protein